MNSPKGPSTSSDFRVCVHGDPEVKEHYDPFGRPSFLPFFENPLVRGSG